MKLAGTLHLCRPSALAEMSAGEETRRDAGGDARVRGHLMSFVSVPKETKNKH